MTIIIKALKDDSKSVCANYDLANDGNEFEVNTYNRLGPYDVRDATDPSLIDIGGGHFVRAHDNNCLRAAA
jgi:hypothetical protein